MISRFLLPDDSEPQLVQALQQKPPLEWTTTASWSGATTNTLLSPNFSALFKDGSSLTRGGLKSEWTMSAQGNTTKGLVQMPALRVQAKDGSSMELEDAGITFNTRIATPFSFWDGPISLKVGWMSVQTPETATQFKLQQLAIHTTTTLQDKLVQMGLKTSIAKVQAPAYSLDNLAWAINFKQVDAAWLDELIVSMQRNQQGEGPTTSLLSSLPELLAAKPEIESHLSLDTPDGPAELSARMAYLGQQPEAFQPQLDLQAHLRAKLPKVVIMQLLDNKVRSVLCRTAGTIAPRFR